jgi:hypothetical protein
MGWVTIPSTVTGKGNLNRVLRWAFEGLERLEFERLTGRS